MEVEFMVGYLIVSTIVSLLCILYLWKSADFMAIKAWSYFLDVDAEQIKKEVVNAGGKVSLDEKGPLITDKDGKRFRVIVRQVRPENSPEATPWHTLDVVDDKVEVI